jgi:hypothetical protein
MARTWAFISFKKFLFVPNISKKKKKEHVACKTQNLATAVAGKMGSLVFLIQNLIFYPKHLKNTLEILLNQSMVTKKLINHPKT